MIKRSKRNFLLYILFSLALTGSILNCGSSSTSTSVEDGFLSGSPALPTNTTFVTGTVSGAIAVAVDQYSNEIDRDKAIGSPKTFTLALPSEGLYKFYLIENEGTPNERIFPIYQQATTIFNISSTITVDLGFIDTSTGIAIPTNNPLNIKGVDSAGDNYEIPSFFSNYIFTLSDLEGDWTIHGLKSADSTQRGGWFYGSAVIDKSGNQNFTTTLNSNGDSTIPSNTPVLSITTSGLLTDSNDLSFHGILSHDRNMIIGILGNIDKCSLIISQKNNTNFIQSNLKGIWNYHSMQTGINSNWHHGVIEIDNFGNITGLSVKSSDGNNESISNNLGLFSINSNGIISKNDIPSLHGVMSSDKNTIIITSSQSNNTIYRFEVLTRSGEVFTINDLKGTWNWRKFTYVNNTQLISGAYGKSLVDSEGNSIITSYSDFNGNSDIPQKHSKVSISQKGIITIDDIPSYHGIVTKSGLTVSTMGNSSNAIQISLR